MAHPLHRVSLSGKDASERRPRWSLFAGLNQAFCLGGRDIQAGIQETFTQEGPYLCAEVNWHIWVPLHWRWATSLPRWVYRASWKWSRSVLSNLTLGRECCLSLLHQECILLTKRLFRSYNRDWRAWPPELCSSAWLHTQSDLRLSVDSDCDSNQSH